MNRKEVIKELQSKKDKNEERFELEDYDTGYKTGYEEAINDSLFIAEQLDEPEKTVLSKTESVWLERVKRVYLRQTDRLHIITRQGWGYDFEVTVGSKEYELSCEPYERTGEDTEHVKQRLVNALLYGYELKEEKLYTVEIPDPNASGYGRTYLGKDSNGKVVLYTWTDFTSIEFADDWKKEEYAQLTEDEIREDFDWAWEANLAEEVKE